MKTARQILKDLFPNCNISGREDMVDYNPKQLEEHLRETLKDREKDWQERCFGDEYYPPHWTDFVHWKHAAGFRIHRDKITFWAHYTQYRDWCNCGERKATWIVYQCL